MKSFVPTYIKDSITEIESDFFCKEDISCVLLDIDNTLVADNQPHPDDRAISFIKRLENDKLQICLISNNSLERVLSFNEKFSLKAVHRAGKPFCRKINKAIKELGADKSKTILIGDQLLTDILAGNRCGIRTMLVNPINISKENSFFKIKRFIENRLLKRKFR